MKSVNEEVGPGGRSSQALHVSALLFWLSKMGVRGDGGAGVCGECSTAHGGWVGGGGKVFAL